MINQCYNNYDDENKENIAEMKDKNNDSDYNIHSNFRLEKNAGYYEISFHLIIVQDSL